MIVRYYYKNLLFVLLGIIAMTSCSSDDENTNNSGNSIAELVINERSYGKLPYACFINNGDGTGSFIFSNQNVSSGSVKQDAKLTYLSVRIPFTSGEIPTGIFTGSNVDADFDVNRIVSTGECELTGWCLKLTMMVSKSGDKHIVEFVTDDLHIFHSDGEKGNGQLGKLTMHYEGKVEVVTYN